METHAQGIKGLQDVLSGQKTKEQPWCTMGVVVAGRERNTFTGEEVLQLSEAWVPQSHKDLYQAEQGI